MFIRRTNRRLPSLTAAQTKLAGELRRDVTILATDIGPRHTGNPERLHLAAEFLTSALATSGYHVACQLFMADGVECANIEVAIAGTDPNAGMIVLGAHYDSVPECPAANDNGSAVAAVLAIARQLSQRSFRRTVRFVLFANEEPPHFKSETMGSLVYARACRDRQEKIDGMICLETIGCYFTRPNSQKWPAVPKVLGWLLPSTGNFIAFIGEADSGRLVRRVARCFGRNTRFPWLAAAIPESIAQVGWSDHWSFNRCGYAAVMVTDTALFRYAHYHCTTDTPDKLDFESMARVVEGIGAVVQELAE